jgi:hypothetical protein
MSQKKGSQGVGPRIRNDLNAAAAESFWMGLFYGHRDEDFACGPSPALAWANAANHRFIYFHIAGKPRVFRMPNGTTKSVKHRPSGFVGTKPHKTVERLG